MFCPCLSVGRSSGSDCGRTVSVRRWGVPELSMGPFYVTRSNPTHQLTDPTQPNPKFWTQPDPTQYNGAYSLVVTYFYAQNSQSRTFSQPSINLFMLFTDRALNALTQSFQIFSTCAVVDPSQTNPPSTQPDQTQPSPWVNTTHRQLWGAH